MSDVPLIHWFRRDLRLRDNLALQAALNSGQPVLPVFIFDPAILKGSAAPRVKFLLNALKSLDAELNHYGSHLVIRYGDPRVILPVLVDDTGAQAVYFNNDYSPFALCRDDAVREMLRVPVHTFDDTVMLAPGAIMKTDGKPYTVYTPFKNVWKKSAKPKMVNFDADSTRFYPYSSDLLPSLSRLGYNATIDVPEASEAVAHDRLERFMVAPIFKYAETRNHLTPQPFMDDFPPTSCLSPYLRFGLLSPRQVYWAAADAYAQAKDSSEKHAVEVWIDELAWREFYIYILYHFPHVHKQGFRQEYDMMEWRHAPDELQAWKDGRTGYPIVDAAMRQLQTIGWMPNRARMIVASFLTKDLLIDYREGERHFMEWLIDGDPAANNGGWQWTAGTGTDAQPYFRIFNPVNQSQKFDPNGDYIRYWIPELRDVPTVYIHTPHKMDKPPKNYQPPIVDHAFARQRTLYAYQKLRGVKSEIRLYKQEV